MVIAFRGRERWREYLEALEQADDEGGTLSPGGAARMLGTTRQNVLFIVENREDVRAWVYYETWGRNAVSYEISVPDLLRWMVRNGKRTHWTTPMIEAALQKVKEAATVTQASE